MVKHSLMKTIAIQNAPADHWVQLFAVAIQYSQPVGKASHSEAGADGRDVIMFATCRICERSQTADSARRQQIEQRTAHAGALEGKAHMMSVKGLFKSLREKLIILDL